MVCYICGREYGTKSLGFHIKSCQKKWAIEQEQLPKNKRRPCPQPPQNFDDLIAGTAGIDLKAVGGGGDAM